MCHKCCNIETLQNKVKILIKSQNSFYSRLNILAKVLSNALSSSKYNITIFYLLADEAFESA